MPHIIIAEDEDDVREFLVRAFRRYAPDAAITPAPDGRAALELLHTHGCDLLVSDQRMPGLSGAGLLQAVRAEGLQVPFIMISADTSAELAAHEYGATAFFYKPLSMLKIREIIETWLSARS